MDSRARTDKIEGNGLFRRTGVFLMLRGVISTLAATAVLWHTLFGCCAHHGHRAYACDDGAGKTWLAYNDSDASGGCTHAPADSKHFCASGVSHQEHSRDPASTPCRGHRPTGCAEGTCVFVARDSSGPSPIDQPGWDVSFPGVVPVERAMPSRASVAVAAHESGVLPVLGGMRLHLANCVLTL